MDNVLGLLHLLGTTEFWITTIEASVLLLLPALGGVISERSGVTNIAMEGLMLTGALIAVMTDLAWHDPWLATLAAMVAGGLMALLHGIISIRFRADQIISGVAINIFSAGLTGYLLSQVYGNAGIGRIDPQYILPYVDIPLLDKIPFLGPILFQENIVVYAAVAILIVVQIVLFRTRLGLRIRAVGEHPQAADTAGINVYRLRYGAVVTSGLLSALSGAFLSLTIVNSFNPNMTAGRGYIALAAMIFGKWTPLGALAACLIFGFGGTIVSNAGLPLPSNLLAMLPYVLVLVVLAGLVGRSTPPAADGIPYVPGEE